MRTSNIDPAPKAKKRLSDAGQVKMPYLRQPEKGTRWSGRLDHLVICASIKGAAILERIVARKTVCLRRLGGERRGELRVGRFFANRKVTEAKLVEGWSLRTGAASTGRHVLAIQACPRT
jgi:hypothetical protein